LDEFAANSGKGSWAWEAACYLQDSSPVQRGRVSECCEVAVGEVEPVAHLQPSICSVNKISNKVLAGMWLRVEEPRDLFGI
jgi:hypothetical protein